jgi:hypothetical protein
MIRERATEICVALQELELPALITLEIIDAVFPNSESIIMYKEWQMACAVKHFHDRRQKVSE